VINIGDLVEWTEMTNAQRKTDNYVNGRAQFHDLFTSPICYGVVLKVKTESLNGIDRTKLFKVYFPDHQQYWIAAKCLVKLA